MTGVRWKKRGSYGRILHKTIKKLEKRFDDELDHDKNISLAKAIGYLASVQREIIKDEENSLLEKRLEAIEKRVGV